MSRFFCKSCDNEGHTANEYGGDRELCVSCNIVCPNCNGKGWLYEPDGDDVNKGPCDFCYGDGWLPELWVSRYEASLGPFRRIKDNDEVARFNRRLHEKFKRRYDKR